MAIATFVLFVAISFLGGVLLVAGIFRGPDGGSLIGLTCIVLGPVGAIAATVELIRSAIPTEQPHPRRARVDT